MEPVHIIQGTAVPLDRSDVDTDQIIPSDWLKRVERTGFEKGLFSEWKDNKDFILNDEAYSAASILIAGPNRSRHDFEARTEIHQYRRQLQQHPLITLHAANAGL